MPTLLEDDIHGSIGEQKYLCTVTWKKGTLILDESEKVGGKALGPDPYSTFLASLAACTLATLRMYIDRKGWVIPEIKITLNMEQEQNEQIITTINRKISFSNEISPEQKERLFLIAEKCPVSKILKNTIHIQTKLN